MSERRRSPFDFSVERPVLSAALNLILVALGLAAIVALPVREFPSIDPPTVSVRTQYIGAAAETVEREVTQIIEDNLSGIDGVRQIQSQSRNQASSITIDFIAGTDIDAAASDVRDRVSAVRSDLPDDVEEPIIEKASADDEASVVVIVRSDDLRPPELTDIANRLVVDRLGSVPGVARVDILGDKTYAMRIWLDRAAMAARGVTPSDVIQRLEAENVVLPGGRLETAQQDISIRADTRFSTPEQFEGLILRDSAGDRVSLGDVATVEVGVENYLTSLRFNGREAVGLGVVRQSTANTLEVASAVREEIEALQDALPGDVELIIDFDESVFIRENLTNVLTTLAQVVGVVVLVTFVFLGSLRATLIPAVVIPASIIPAFVIAWMFGYSVNVLTILALILAISLTTDDAVVIVENVRRRMKDGEAMPLGALNATRQVGFATFASGAVLIAVILPLGLIPGNVGRLFREFAVVLAAVVAVSTVASLTLAPMLSSKLFKETKKKPNRFAAWFGRMLDRGSDRYQSGLKRAIGRPLVPAIAAVVLLGLGGLAFTGLSREVAPTEDRSALSIRIQAPVGAGFAYTSAKVAEIERLVAERYMVPPGEDPAEAREDAPERAVESMLAVVTPSYGGGSSETNLANLRLRLADWGERDIAQADLEQRLQADLAQVTGIQAFASSPPSLGQQRRGPQLQFVLIGQERQDVVGWSESLLEAARDIPGLQNPDTTYEDRRPELTATVDRSRAAALGVDAAQVGEALQVMFGSLQVTRYSERGEEYDVIVQAQASDRDLPSDIQNTYVRSVLPGSGGAAGGAAQAAGSLAGAGGSVSNVAGAAAAPAAGATTAGRGAGATGALVPLSAVVRLQERGAVQELNRLDRLPSISLEASLTPEGSLGDLITELETLAEETLPSEAQIGYIGEALDLQETGSSIYLLLGLVLVLVYLILAGQFESFIHPVIVLISAPLAIAGGVLTMWLFDLTVNIYTQIALVLLVGLAAKNAILLVEFANQLRAEGKDATEAALGAASLRLRPILMTSVATVLGAIPLVLESGAGAEARRTLGVVTAGGLTVATLMTLIVVPVAYVVLSRFARPPDAAKKAVEKQEAEADDEAQDGAGRADEDRPDPSAPRPEGAR